MYMPRLRFDNNSSILINQTFVHYLYELIPIGNELQIYMMIYYTIRG